MGAMAGAGSVPERREAREILEATAATRQLMVGSCNRQPPYSWKSDTTTKPWTSYGDRLEGGRGWGGGGGEIGAGYFPACWMLGGGGGGGATTLTAPLCENIS